MSERERKKIRIAGFASGTSKSEPTGELKRDVERQVSRQQRAVNFDARKKAKEAGGWKKSTDK